MPAGVPCGRWANYETWAVLDWLTGNDTLYHEYQRLQEIEDLQGLVRGLVFGTVQLRGLNPDEARSIQRTIILHGGSLHDIDWNQLWITGHTTEGA